MAYYTDERRYFDDIHMHGHHKKILFEGDSWFSIPDIANIPIQLDSRCDLSILCLADPGDTLADLSSGRQFKKIESLIHDNRFGQKWDALVFSSGGNDVIGPGIRKLLRSPSTPSNDPNHYLDQNAAAQVFNAIKDGFLEIKRLRDQSDVNHDTPIFVHTYNYLTPRNVAHKVFAWKVSGPWIYPHMQSASITSSPIQEAIVATLLDRFHDVLRKIELLPDSNFFVIDTRQALMPAGGNLHPHWRDEIHPSSKGFAHLAKQYFIPTMASRGAI